MIYLDNNASTPLLPAVWTAMQAHFTDIAGNPASAHAAGRQARRALEEARARVAAALHAEPDEVVFTSGATEANNLALTGLVGQPPGHVIVSAVEHPSVAEPARRLGQAGFAVDWLPVNGVGVVRTELLAGLLRPETRLIAVQLANHETGAVQPIADLASGGRKPPEGSAEPRMDSSAGLRPPLAFHCDATQAVGKLPVDFHGLGVSTLSLSAHKFHGPKGVGALLVRRGVNLQALFAGGHQQQGRRPGTESVALAAGLAAALDLSVTEAAQRRTEVLTLRRHFLDHLRREAAPVVLNGPEEGGLPHALNLSFPGCRAESLLMNFDLAQVACSAGSACSSGSLLPSPVLQAMGLPPELLHSAVRFSFSHLLSVAEVEEAARRIVRVCQRLRSTAGAAEA